MEKILEVVNYVKDNINILNYEEIKNNIEKILHNEILNNFFNDKDITFILDLIIENISLNTDTLKEIICNFKKKIEYKILISKENNNSEIEKNYSKENNDVYTKILNIFSDFGSIFIHPKKVIILWNEKDLKNSNNSNIFNYNKQSNKTLLDYDNIEILNKETEYIIKYINYDLIFNTNNFKNYPLEIFDNFNRKIGLFQDKNGFITKYQLAVYNNQCSINNLMYKGILTFYFNKNKKTFLLKDTQGLEKILKYFKKDIIKIFKKHKFYTLKLQYIFLKNDFLKDYLDLILKVFEYDHPKLYVLKEEKEIIKIYKSYKNEFYEIENKCPHENLINEFFKDQNNYFKKIEEFMEENINYENDLAFCKICGEIITNLNIKEINEYDTVKYIGYINNILEYPPYNNIFNSRYYFENFFFLFNNYTKINFINNTDYLIKISLDNFIHISSNRLELEYKYKEDVLNNNIFFIRFSNNFFEIDLEKEKFSEKKTVFTFFLIIIVLCSFLNINDFNHLIFVKKIINLNKIKKNDEYNFDNIVTLLIIFLFKNLNIEFYNNEKNKFDRINRTVKIYKEIINDELKLIYNNKAKNIEEFIINKKNINYKVYISYSNNSLDTLYSDLNEEGQYMLNLENVFNNILYNSQYNFFSLYEFNEIKKNKLICKNENENENENFIFIDFYELNKFDINNIDKKNQNLYLNVTHELNNLKYFLYENKQCIVKSLVDQKIIKNKYIEKDNNVKNFISSLGVSIKDISNNINKNEDEDDENEDNNLNNNKDNNKTEINNESIITEDIGGKKETISIIEEIILKNDDNYILIFNNKTFFKKYIEIEDIIPVTNSTELKFFLNGDKYVFKKKINKKIYLEVLEGFIDFIKIFFNINFYTNIYNYFENNNINFYDKNILIKNKLFLILFLIKKKQIKENFLFEYKNYLENKIE